MAARAPSAKSEARRVRLASYLPYVRSVEQMAASVLAGDRPSADVLAALDGGPNRTLATTVDLESRRQAGAFFTGSEMRDGPFRELLPSKRAVRAAIDPACGAGDLLLAWTDTLPSGPDLSSTLALWQSALRGWDVHEEFVRLTRARLVLAAAQRSTRLGHCTTSIEEAFPNVCVGDGVAGLKSDDLPPWVVMNPPFGRERVASGCSWATGSVSHAATFAHAAIEALKPGQHLVAILPDVLRTGPTMRRWREEMNSLAKIEAVRSTGQFASDIDIDVFLLRATRTHRAATFTGWWEAAPPLGKVRDLLATFTVSVGPIVPHRHVEEGTSMPFLHAQNLPRNGESPEPPERVRYTGSGVMPPFVAVRRTSRPGDIPRARPTVVRGNSPMAVENHLIVLVPDDGLITTCRALATELTSNEVSQWLDQRLRGRHLTTTAFRELGARSARG